MTQVPGVYQFHHSGALIVRRDILAYLARSAKSAEIERPRRESTTTFVKRAFDARFADS